MKRIASWALAIFAALACFLPATAAAHGGSPNYRSTVRDIAPPIPGLEVRVLNYDDRLELVNRTGKDIAIRGYDGEPYVRLEADGTVEVNKRSPSFYLNEERFADVQIPPEAKASARPRWEQVSKTGRFEWHDHRIHFMSKTTPKQVKDEDQRTKVFDWKVPVVVGAQRANIAGDLYWVPSDDSGLPRGALVGLALLVVGGIVLVEVVRRRRHRGPPRRGGEAF